MSAPGDRQSRLNALQSAVTDFAKKQTTELNLRVSTCQALLKGRTGSSSLAQTASQGVLPFAVDSINTFLAS